MTSPQSGEPLEEVAAIAERAARTVEEVEVAAEPAASASGAKEPRQDASAATEPVASVLDVGDPPQDMLSVAEPAASVLDVEDPPQDLSVVAEPPASALEAEKQIPAVPIAAEPLAGGAASVLGVGDPPQDMSAAAEPPASALEVEEQTQGVHAAAEHLAGGVGVNRSAEAAWPLSSSSSPKYDAKCFANAGAEYCSNLKTPRDAGQCVCPNGCMGADGSCYQEENKPIGKGFTLSNKKWPTYTMYFQRLSVFGQLKTTSISSKYNLGQDKFRLYELPGKMDGKKEYFLGSDLWKDTVVSMQNTGGTSVSLWGAYAVSLKKYHQPWNLRDTMLWVCSARKTGHADAVMIGTSTTFGGSTVWAYIKPGTYFVFGYWYPERLIISKVASSGAGKNASVQQLPDEAGHWIPSPPFKRGVLPDC